MIYLIFAGVMLISLFLWVIVEIKKSVHLLYIIPITIFFFGGTYFYYDYILGKPKPSPVDKKFVVISYYISSEEDKIFLWTLQSEEKDPISIWIPYSQETHESLEKSKKKMLEGKTMVGIINSDKDGSDNSGDGSQGDKESGIGTNKSKGGDLNLYEMDFNKFLNLKNQ